MSGAVVLTFADGLERVMAEVIVHRATPRNLGAIADLFDAYRVFYGNESSPEACRAFINERFRLNDSVLSVAEIDGEVVGFTQLLQKISTSSMSVNWILNDLFVSERARREGVASALIEDAISFARTAGAKKLTLIISDDNDASIKLYESHGWERVPDFDTWVMHLEEEHPHTKQPEIS